MRYCFEERIEDVADCEQYFTSQQLAEFGYPHLEGTSNRGNPTPASAYDRGRFRLQLTTAWDQLLLDFVKRLEQGQFKLTGVQTTPTLEEQRRDIPSQWAIEFQIDALRDVIRHRKSKYVVVRAESANDQPAVDQPVVVAPAEPTKGRLPTITAENIRALTDDEVLVLLEDHARRVIEGPDGMLLPPGKTPLLPLARGKMRHRADHGELLPTLSAEAAWLHNWVTTKVTLIAVPSASTIGKVLGKEYSLLKARSKPAT